VIEREAAVRIVEEELDRENRKWSARGVDLTRVTVVDVKEHELVWIVSWQSEEFARTRNPGAMLVGNGPYLVDRVDGGLHRIGASPRRAGSGRPTTALASAGRPSGPRYTICTMRYAKSPPRAGESVPCAPCVRGCRRCPRRRPSST
jgi:hypothetical protein